MRYGIATKMALHTTEILGCEPYSLWYGLGKDTVEHFLLALGTRTTQLGSAAQTFNSKRYKVSNNCNKVSYR